MADNKFAAYVCTGCGIGDKLDVAALEKIATKEGKMAVVKNHAFLCNAEGVQMIRDDIEKEGVTHVCIAACSRRAKTEAFNFPTAAVSRANLREGVLWVVAEGADHDEVRQEMAEDYVRMGCAEVKKMKVPAGNPAKPRRASASWSSAAASSGMTAALAAAEAGYEAVLVEKTGALGGFAAKLSSACPSSRPTPRPSRPHRSAGGEVTGTPHPLHLASTLTATAGAPGRFNAASPRHGAPPRKRSAPSSRPPASPRTTSRSCPNSAAAGHVVDQAGFEAPGQAAEAAPSARRRRVK